VYIVRLHKIKDGDGGRAHIRTSLSNICGTLLELLKDILPAFCETLLIVGRSLDDLAL
jgi:hypothetical protein